MEKLPGDYVAGFVDGEGCFALKFVRTIRHERKNKPIYFYWDIEFAIVLRGDDKEILEQINYTLGCGHVGNVDKRGTVRYAVTGIDDLMDVVVPFFEKHPLRAKKKNDFVLWREAVSIIKRNQRSGINSGKGGFQKTQWNPLDIERLKEIKQEMDKYKGGSGSRTWKWLRP